MKNLLVAQSGGPTVAINTTVVGVLQAAQINTKIDNIYGAIGGIVGVFEENFIDLKEIIKDTGDMEILSQTPAAALGSCRFLLENWKINESQYKKFLDIVHKHQIAYFVYIGGNDSMDTVYKLSEYCKIKGIEDIKIMGAPKTIDNDLVETDHCPGFGSAAKYIATTILELERDISVYKTPSVTIVEIMGRNAGWLTAASALARVNGGVGPSLIYLCESVFNKNQFIEDIKLKLKERNAILIAVSEGIKDAAGNYISATEQLEAIDAFGHKYIAGTGRVLENIVRDKIGCKVRSIELNLMQRSAAHIASETDINESKILGMKALACAMEGTTGEMASIKRMNSNPYTVEYTSVPVEKVANHEKKVPLQLIHKDGNDVTSEMIEYLIPLIQGEVNTRYENGIPKHMSL
jgi:ATP-dependent phosphofructokinase / diphosphate-dependent phosphofructokinase